MSHTIIRRIRLAHCKRGPVVCDLCREAHEPQICLLDISPPNPGELQRRVIQLSIGGDLVWREFDVVRIFESEAEALSYAKDLGISDVQLE